MKAVYLILAVMLLAGCNTFHGLGKDLQNGGKKIEQAADRNG
ncbi:MAG: entericidin A/B family lipoprotein [Gallionella sp.]